MTTAITETTVVLLAAGHGKRMLPLTETTPKPLLKVGELSLIEHHLQNLGTQGFINIIINIAYLGEQIRDHLGCGNNFGVNITYSDESETGALETAGGIAKALTLIKSDPFIVINADIWTDYSFKNLLNKTANPAYLVLVENPEHNLGGDFSLSKNSSNLININSNDKSYTFSGIAKYKKSLFTNLSAKKYPLAPIFNKLLKSNELKGELYNGQWNDIGTPQRLAEMNAIYNNSTKELSNKYDAS